MASRTRKKGSAGSTRRSSGAGRGKARATKAAKTTRGVRAAKARTKSSPKKAAARKPARAATPKRAAATADKQLGALRARFEREKRSLETRLTESIREIGQLRHHEMRVTQLERELKERDDTIAQLRRDVEQLRSRAEERRGEYAPSGQQSLALGAGGRDLDEFDDVALDEDELL